MRDFLELGDMGLIQKVALFLTCIKNASSIEAGMCVIKCVNVLVILHTYIHIKLY